MRASRLLQIALLWLAAVPARAEPPAWDVDPAASAITVTATQMGGSFEGRFERFRADIAFDPDDLAASRVAVTVETGSLDTGNDQRDAAAKGADWFDVAAHPTAHFEAATFRRSPDGGYEADGTLTIKGIARPVALPFTLTVEGDRARAAGRVEVARADFALGTGEWASNGVVGDQVTIAIDVTAARRP